MTRLLGPDPNTRTTWRLVGKNFQTAAGGVAVVYSDAAGSVHADVRYYDPLTPATPGGAISGSALTVDYKSEFPQFWFPDGIDVVYISVDGGPLVEVHANYDARIDALAAGSETPAGAQAKADAAQAAATAAAATDATTKANAAQAAAASDATTKANSAQSAAATDATTKANAAQAAAIAASAPKLATAARTANFTAAAGTLYLVDTTTAAVTATLPAANVAGQQVMVKLYAGPNPVNVVRSGSDTIGASATSAALTLASEIFEFVSNGSGQWHLVGGNKTITSLDARFGRTAASVTDRAQWETFGLSSTGTTGRTTRTYYVATADCADLTLWWVGATGDESTPLGNSFGVKAAVELVPGPQSASGTVYPVTFNGATTATVVPGQVLRSDPLPVDLLKGAAFYVRTYCSVTVSGTDSIPLGRQHNASLFEASVLSSDLATSTGTWTGSASYTCGPVRIDGVTGVRSPTLAMIGSSTFEGIGDVQDTSTPGGGTYGWGWVRRLAAGNVGLVHLAKASETAQQFASVARRRTRTALVVPCDYAIEGYGANDINGGRTLAQVQADKLTIWTALATRRCRVWTPTLHPNLTTSTDSFATTGNQTTAATNSVRVALNAWIRAGAPIDPTTKAAVAIGTVGALLAAQSGHPLTGWLEVADTVETARDSGIYRAPGYTTDGQHLTSTACAAVVAALVNPFI